MKRVVVLIAAACLALALIGTVGAAGVVGKRPDFGPPGRDVPRSRGVVPLANAQAQVDYPVPAATWLPEGTQLVGAFFPVPSLEALYPDAPETSRGDLARRNRLRPLGLLYEGPGGSFTIVRSSITAGPPPPPGARGRPFGLEQVAGNRVATDGFEYVVRRGEASLLPGDPRFPPVALTSLTWRSPNTKPLPGGWQVQDLQWTISGTIPEEQLVQVARNFR